MHISIITDELSGDPATSFELGLEWGVSQFELRGVGSKRIPRVSTFMRNELIRLVRSLDITITAISSGLFKIPFPGSAPKQSNLGWMAKRNFDEWSSADSSMRDHLHALLPETIEFALEVGAPYLIAFSFERGGQTGDAPAAVVDAIAAAAEMTSTNGLRLLIENEEGHWANTGAATVDLIERIGPDKVGVNWDPANAQIDGECAFPDGYDRIRAHIENVHFKDVKCLAGGSWEIVEHGDVDWDGQIAALVRDGYTGAIAAEPHLAPPVASTRNALARIRACMEDANRELSTK